MTTLIDALDVDKIALGVDFTQVVAQAVSDCAVLLAVIGPGWLTATDEDGQRRLDDPDDIVRLEIQTALERGIVVIPVLVEGAVMPRPRKLPEGLAKLARRNAHFLRLRADTLDRSAASVRESPRRATKPSTARQSTARQRGEVLGLAVLPGEWGFAAVREPQEVVLILRFHLPEHPGLADAGHRLARPVARRVNVADHLLGDSPLLRAGAEDFGTVLRTNDAFIKVGSVNLEEHLQ
jgi:hypothetical protein